MGSMLDRASSLSTARTSKLLAIAMATARGIRPSITLMHVIGIGIGLAMVACLGAQSASDTALAFEVASIKKHFFSSEVSQPCGGVSISGNRVTIPCIQLRNLIIKARDYVLDYVFCLPHTTY